MTEITRVPLQPIAKGSLTKLWLAVAAAVALGGGIAWSSLAAGGVDVEVVQEGTGASPKIGDVVFLKYVGKLPDGTEFDRSRPLPIPPGLFPDGSPLPLEEGQIIPGFIDGLQKMKKGGKYKLEIPADKAYGASPPQGSPIPPNSDLNFDIEVVDIMPKTEFEQRVAAFQQMMQAQQGGGAPQGAPQEPASPPPSAPSAE